MSSLLMERHETEEHLIKVSESTKETDRKLLIDSRQYAKEDIRQSWWHFATTLVALAAAVAVAAFVDVFMIRLFASVIIGLLFVRMFIIYHDYQHQAILKDSRLANAILTVYGYLMLTPPSVWRRTHNHHHRNNSKLFGASIGSFPIMTCRQYAEASWARKLEYRISRSPLIIVFGYFSVFLFGMTLLPMITDFRRHWDSLPALLCHFGLTAACVVFSGWEMATFVFLLPTFIAMCCGSYLFYIQHNFPTAKIRHCEEWSYTDAALHSSSYLHTGRVMRWFTGNIGYHHVHHLNAKIPFYRLPEAMEGLPPLQSPSTTSLRIADILACLRLKLWDTKLDRFVGYNDPESLEVAVKPLEIDSFQKIA